MVEIKSIDNIGETVRKTYEKNKDLIESLVKDKSKDELCQIACELDMWQWNEEKLGELVSNEIAWTLCFYIYKKIGSYRIMKYYHLCFLPEDMRFYKTEEDFNKHILERAFNEVFINPLWLQGEKMKRKKLLKLTYQRQLKELTQEQFAEKLGISIYKVVRYENGYSKPNCDMLLKMAEVLECTVNDILG